MAASKTGATSQEDRVRAAAEALGYQLRRADHQADAWHLVDPNIDGKLYAFAFTRPHTFSLSEIEDLLKRRAAAAANEAGEDS